MSCELLKNAQARPCLRVKSILNNKEHTASRSNLYLAADSYTIQFRQFVVFAQCQLRHDYVEGTETSPVGYLEGILVEEAYRHKGYAKELLRECEQWAKSKGCTEFASDCELENEESLRFHMAMQFEEANRVICFRKDI